MSCSGEVVEGEEQLIQIKPAISEQLKKAKYGVSNHSTVELCHWTKNHSNTKVVATNTSSMESPLIDVWNFLQPECIVKIVVYIVGDQWSFMIH
ncbi:tRNA-modifying protein [Marine Group I thaumarchaeote SCGC AAA799-D11]|uniref:tRNA-modifying protein n=1 Tax=Marine Group I thaumarchaeote SCGC AAA799-D11 TaxID=1502291 RepID=A0A087RNS4_9ARCH|nr:tRNA-modifying protein [Marine Group I thaumarchaeote SCGC AAA799-D11]